MVVAHLTTLKHNLNLLHQAAGRLKKAYLKTNHLAQTDVYVRQFAQVEEPAVDVFADDSLLLLPLIV